MLLAEQERQSVRTDEHKRSDLLFFTLIILFTERGVEKVSRERLHRAWETYLWLLKRKGFEYEGFYKDIVFESYQTLDDAIIGLLGICLYIKKPQKGDNIYIAMTRSLIARIRTRATEEEWEAIRASVRYLDRRLHTPRRKWWYK